jgi:uncharacterized protein DUF5615
MSRPRFLADEDLRGSIVQAVRRLEPQLEFATTVGQGWKSTSDSELLDLAYQHQWLIVSHDVNTMKAFAEERIADGLSIHGLFLLHQSSTVRLIAENLVLIWIASEFEEWRDRIVYLPF